MGNLKIDEILNIVNEEKKKRKLDNYVPLFPMLRKDGNKLYIGVLLTHENDNIWVKNNNVKPSFWVLLDVNTLKVLEFNKTQEKDFLNKAIVINTYEDEEMELSKYTVKKTKEYKDYLLNDIKEDKLPIQKKLASVLNNEMNVDGEKINIDDYLMANIKPEITKKVDELVDLLVTSKYSSITFYYDNLFNSIIKEYQSNNNIDEKKMKLCIEIMNIYYFGMNGIENFFNI